MGVTQILQALGGIRFQSSVGARAFSYPNGGISFGLCSAKRGIDRVMIIPTGSEFTMTFFSGDARIATVSGVRQDQLRAVLRLYTGV